MLKALASHLPTSLYTELRRWHFRRAILSGRFKSVEPEFDILASLVAPGDLVIDVGANVGHYTLRLAELVGPTGHVLALEPIGETFSILCANTLVRRLRNVTLLNVAASDHTELVAMSLPRENGAPNYYQAQISARGEHSALSVPLDAIGLERVAFIKIDVEGHELAVLNGARETIERDHPSLVVEGSARCEAANWLRDHGYDVAYTDGSANIVCRYRTVP